MRLLHTADWHLGRTLHGASLLAAQERVIDHLVEVACDERPDAVVVAGDVFDRAYPPLDAVELFDESVARLAALDLPVVITSGNHDSAIRLGALARVAERSGVHVRTRVDRIPVPIVIPGSGGAPDLVLYAIPYLDPPSSAASVGALQPTHSGVLGAALGQIATDLTSRAGALSVVVGHGVVTGGRPITDDGPGTVERSIDVGGVSAVPGELFAGIDYVALGHLHRPQGLGDRIRYSGAPLAFAFDETGDRKSVALVTLAPGAAPEVELVPTPQPRAMARLRGTLADLLSASKHKHAEAAWVEATLTDRLRPKQAMEQLRRRFPHVLKLEHRPEQALFEGDGTAVSYGDRIRGKTELEIAERFLAEVRGGVAPDAAEHGLLAASLEALAREEALR